MLRRLLRRHGLLLARRVGGGVRPRRRLNVEADVEDVAVLDDVRLPLQALLSRPRGLRVPACLDEVVPPHDLATDEAACDVGVDRLRGVERALAAPQRPRPRLLLARGEERDQVERLREPAHDLAQRRLASAAALRRASPDFACFATRSSRRSTWSRSATSSSSFNVSRSSAGTRVPEKPSRTTRSASTCRRLPSSAGPVPGTSTTRTAAGVILRAPTVAATRSSRSSGICAIPTCSLPEPCVSARVSARKSVVFPELGSPTIPTSSATRGG